MDRLILRDVRLHCLLGVHAHERREPREVLLNLVLEMKPQRGGHTDLLQDTVDYAAIEKEVIEHVRQSSYFLVEKLAEEVARICLRHSEIIKASVTIDKPGALKSARSVAIAIERDQPGPR